MFPFLQDKDLRLIFVGGKGGVGKTTLAAAMALDLARTYGAQKKILLISTDPAHSLSDVFGLPIGDKITPINPNLFAWELDANRRVEEFKQKNNRVLRTLADRGTYFDQEDISQFLDLSIPGIDEVMAMMEMARLLDEGLYDLLMLDTAPTGHTVRMLGLPNQMLKWVKVLDMMQEKHRYMSAHLTGRPYNKDPCDRFLEDLFSQFDRVKGLLSKKDRTRFIPVTIPEPMAIEETRRLLRALEKLKVPVKEILVNRVLTEVNCPWCQSRKEEQTRHFLQAEKAFSPYRLINVPLFPGEIRGIPELLRLADVLAGRAGPPPPRPGEALLELAQTALTIAPTIRFVLVGGKGGVGKTSTASAVALDLARNYQEKKVLLFSLDPAHSLSDCLGLPIGDQITPIEWAEGRGQRAEGRRQGAVGGVQWADDGNEGHPPHTAHRLPPTALAPNFFAIEIDPEGLFEKFKQDYEDDIKGLFDRFLGQGLDLRMDREIMTNLLAFSPPGLDEIMALERIMGLMEENAFDLYVLDTAPTGHFLRFLESPDLIRQWLHALFRLLLKYKGVVRLTRVAEKALALTQAVRKIQQAFGDPQKTTFIAVTIPEAMAMEEFKRLHGAAQKAGLQCQHLVVNMVIPARGCAICRSIRMDQDRWIQGIRSAFPSLALTLVPLFARPVQGIADLDRMAMALFQRGSP